MIIFLRPLRKSCQQQHHRACVIVISLAKTAMGVVWESLLECLVWSVTAAPCFMHQRGCAGCSLELLQNAVVEVAALV